MVRGGFESQRSRHRHTAGFYVQSEKEGKAAWHRAADEAKDMCYISDWPKRFLKTVLLQLSRHQVGEKRSWLWSPRGRGRALAVCEERRAS